MYILYCIIYYIISYHITSYHIILYYYIFLSNLESVVCRPFRDGFWRKKYHFTTLVLDWSESSGNKGCRVCIKHFRHDLTSRDRLNSDHKGVERESSEALTLNCRLCSDKTTLKIISVWGIQNNYVNEADISNSILFQVNVRVV